MKRFLLYSCLIFILAACSNSPDNDDPYQKFNRGVFEFNLSVDKNILRPTAIAYKDVTTNRVRQSVSSFLGNLKEPFYFINYAISLDADHAVTSFFRFILNSTIGVLGLVDIGEQIGLRKSETSHKETLRRMGMPTGDYIMLPLLGFSSTRDTIAEPISWFMDPINYFIGLPYVIAKTVLNEVSYRAENAEFIDSMMKDSLDLYAATKSIYFQKYGVKTPEQEKDEEFDDSDEAADLPETNKE